MKKNNSNNFTAKSPDTTTVEDTVDLTDFTELSNEKDGNNEYCKGRKLTARNSTFVLDEGTYKGTITGAFWYKTPEERDRVMFVFELDDGTEFKNSVDGDWVEDYPFSKLISQANVEYVENFIGLKVQFDIRNSEGDTVTFSHIRKISIVQ